MKHPEIYTPSVIGTGALGTALTVGTPIGWAALGLVATAVVAGLVIEKVLEE